MAKVSRTWAPAWVGPGLLILFTIPLLVYATYSIADRWYQGYLLAQEEAAVRADVVRLRDENLQLQRALNEARGDAAIEKVAREQLGLIKPGDRSLVIVVPASAAPETPRTDPPRSEPLNPPLERPSPAEKPGWLRFLDAIFKR